MLSVYLVLDSETGADAQSRQTISDIRQSEHREGVLRIKVELMDESAYTLWWPVAR